MGNRRGNGFGTLISKGPGRAYLARWVYRGRTYYRSTGRIRRSEALKELERLTRPFREKTDAEVLRSLESRVKAAEETASSESVPLDGMFDAYAESLESKGASASTMRLYGDYSSSLASWLAENTECSEMRDVGEREAERYLSFAAKKFCPAAYNLRLSFFRRLWRVLAAKAGLSSNVWDGFRKASVPKGSPRRPFTKEELAKTLREASKDPPMLLMFAAGAYTGLRLGDCAELKWKDVDLAAGVLRVVPRKTRRHMPGPLEIPVHRALGRLLAAWNAEAYAAGRLHEKTKAVLDRAGVSGVTFHCLRHTFISVGIDSGLSPMLVQRIVGHSSVDMTAAYWHSNLDAARSAVAALPDWTAGEAKPAQVPGLSEEGLAELRKAFMDSDGDLDGTVRRLLKESGRG